MQNFIERRMNELNRLEALAEPDCAVTHERAAAIVGEVADRMARMGHSELMAESIEYAPACDPMQAKVFLSRCLSAIAPPKIASPFFDSSQACEYLGITAGQLYRQVELRKIVPLRGPRNRYRFTKEQLDDYVRNL
jgi:excisionase family DNA binding protein